MSEKVTQSMVRISFDACSRFQWIRISIISDVHRSERLAAIHSADGLKLYKSHMNNMINHFNEYPVSITINTIDA